MIDQFKPVTKIRGSYLFQEGDLANHIYIVVEGEFKVIKKIHREKAAFDLNAEAIFKDPLKAKRQNSEFDVRNHKTGMDMCTLETVNRNQFLGIEDIVNQNQRYTMSCVCESQKGIAIAMTKHDFLKLKSNEQVWNLVRKAANKKVDKFCNKIINNTIAEVKLIDSLS